MIAIQFENVGKLYRLGTVGTGTLSHDLNRWWKTRVLHQEDPYLKIGETNDRATHGHSDYVWALKNISFSVEQGDVVGIIGKNGAGKSTLLKLLSQITSPTSGVIRARGRIGSLLEVGTGFHPEMTGRENIYMNGSIMGMTRAEITRKLDEIIDFAGVARYIDTPVKRYSSGMTVRLGFAVAAFMEPEILVVDEVLAVGDAEFQKKAIGKMQDVSRGDGRTVLFVSHNMGSVRRLCSRGILLENGCIEMHGSVSEVIQKYISGYEIRIRNKEWNIKDNKELSIIGVKLLVEGKDDNQLIDMDDKIYVQITYYVKKDISNTNISFVLFKDGIDLFHSWDVDNSPELLSCRKKGYHQTGFFLPQNLLPGFYDISIDTGRPKIGVIDSKSNCIQFEVTNINKDGDRKSFMRGGMVRNNIKWQDKLL
ncbi:MAG: ABC transporter ATP-binding protein [Prevotella sp.]|nr:ABC transporter ATP-binding protein [Prevotella sp.]